MVEDGEVDDSSRLMGAQREDEQHASGERRTR
jgi:hypothetical protein